jgi:protein-disulfide isomerase
MFAIGRRKLLLGVATTSLLAACGGGGANGAVSAEDMAIGQANAPATLIEYASSTCPHCAHFHETVFGQLKTNYIDTGKLRYVFREYPTSPEAIAVAGFQVARCGGASPEQYMNRVGEIFRQQGDLFAAIQSGSTDGVRQKFVDIGAAAGLTPEQVMTCISDQAGAERVRHTVEEGNRQFQITGTPTLILNGRKLEDPSAVTYAGLSRIIDAELASHH